MVSYFPNTASTESVNDKPVSLRFYTQHTGAYTHAQELSRQKLETGLGTPIPLIQKDNKTAGELSFKANSDSTSTEKPTEKRIRREFQQLAKVFGIVKDISGDAIVVEFDYEGKPILRAISREKLNTWGIEKITIGDEVVLSSYLENNKFATNLKITRNLLQPLDKGTLEDLDRRYKKVVRKKD